MRAFSNRTILDCESEVCEKNYKGGCIFERLDSSAIAGGLYEAANRALIRYF